MPITKWMEQNFTTDDYIKWAADMTREDACPNPKEVERVTKKFDTLMQDVSDYMHRLSATIDDIEISNRIEWLGGQLCCKIELIQRDFKRLSKEPHASDVGYNIPDEE